MSKSYEELHIEWEIERQKHLQWEKEENERKREIINRVIKNVNSKYANAPVSAQSKKYERGKMTKKLRCEILLRDKYTCQICGYQDVTGMGLEVDHIIPIAKGGKSIPTNLQTLCRSCNKSKGAKIIPTTA